MCDAERQTGTNKLVHSLDLGTIALEGNSENLGEVVVQGEKSTMEFKLDKRVFNVGSDLSSTGAGALEVLNNVPSVNVYFCFTSERKRSDTG
mgnify:CR=1 FL=1